MNNKLVAAPAGLLGTDDLTAATAWVETPLQLLSVLEAHSTGRFAKRCHAIPRSGSAALEATVAEIKRLGLPADLTVLPARDEPRDARTDAGLWFIGDAFSGKVQRALLRDRRRRYVVVDDGLATLHLLRLLVKPVAAPLVRARVRAGVSRKTLGLATALRLRAAARAGRLAVFTVIPLPDDLAEQARRAGISIVNHDFTWLRAQPDSSAPEERRVVLGAAMVNDGLIRADRYLEWVGAHAAKEPVLYYPHRREDASTLEPLSRVPGVRIAGHGLPAEVGLRGLTAGHRVVSLPSTAVTSLRVLLGTRGVRIDAAGVPEDWWTAEAAPSLRAHLSTFVHSPEETR
ncbi:hypothetical protein HDA32_004819 [Spinactinospora alkalitolerans]|uniref:Uncharacterized protein n=1 Tax=Spinactinospora alkalitolerans TaxID=687207 RepID=A0A852U0C5_9ACTN|nr:hypothetical protein [Spinactinospora alkalitolerans]NYE49699.1 hypothetical protein [Spinactinospora alkalitolerans]